MSHKNQTNSYTKFCYHFFRNILIVSLPLLVISAIVLSSIHSSATGSSSGSGTDSLTISISSSCTLSSVVNTDHSDDVKAGTYKDNIGKTTIKTTCNDNNGYSIYANGYTNNEEGNNKLINTLSPSNVIETGLNTSGDISSWAMKLNNLPDDPSPTPPVIESAYDDTYGLVPNNWTKVLSLSSGTTDMSLGSSFTTTYAVYANSRQYTGTYQGQVKYVLTHPNINSQHFFMQDIAQLKDKILLNEGDSAQLVDQRDGKVYWVTKLADGNIWMTQNLDFDISANATLNSKTTDLNVIYDSSTGQYAEYNNGYTENNSIIYWTPANTAITIGFQGAGPVTGWTNNHTKPYSANKTDDVETGHASLGNYYNWTAAIASNDSSGLSNGNATNSVCPKGWRLPNANNDEFTTLNNLYNNGSTVSNSGLTIAPLWFTKSGNVNAGKLNFASSNGYYWSSTASTSNVASNLRFTNSSVNPNYRNTDYGRDTGFSVRCLAR